MLELYNYLTTYEGCTIIENCWRSAGIKDAIEGGVNSLQPLDPFSTIDPLITTEHQEYLPPQITDDPDLLNNFASRQLIDSDDEGWGPDDMDEPFEESNRNRNILNILNAEQLNNKY